MKIDEGISRILPMDFVREELKRHGRVRSVSIDRGLFTRKKWWACCDDEGQILLDPTAPRAEFCASINETFPGLDLKTDEVCLYFFFHELRHSDGVMDEMACHRYARRRILQWRLFSEIQNLVFNSASEGIREAFQEIRGGQKN